MTSAPEQYLAIYRNGRSRVLDTLAYEQALLSIENETDMSEEDAALVNAASFRNRGERKFFKNQYRRYARYMPPTLREFDR